jgi:hypothetical protein
MIRPLSLVLLAATAACSFSYRNPTEDLRAGEVGGRAVVAAVPQAGVAVSVKGSTLAQGTRPTGKFLLLPLPAGVHTLLLRSGAGDLVARDVEIRYGRDGQPEGVWLGDVPVPPAGAAAARVTFTLSSSSGPWSDFANGTVHDALTGATTSFTGASGAVALSAGAHALSFTGCNTMYATAPCQVGGPITVVIGSSELGFEKRLADVPLHVPAATSGRLKVRLAAIGAVDLSGYGLTLNGSAQATDSTGLADVTVAEGMYTVGVTGPAAASAEVPPAVVVPVIASHVTDLGTLYVTAAAASSQTAYACAADADCAPGACVARSCQGAFDPPIVTPASVPVCEDRGCGVGQPCALPYATIGALCLNAGSGISACVTQGTCCTVDGITSVCAPIP